MLVDYLSCYLEVILLLSIEIERVVEVLMDIFFRGGVLWEMLIDMGIWFILFFMKEVSCFMDNYFLLFIM